MKNSKNLLPGTLLSKHSRLIDYVYTHTHMLQNTCFVQFLRFYYIFSSMYCTTHTCINKCILGILPVHTGEGTSERAGACLFLQNQVTTTTRNTRTCIKLYVSLLRVIFTCQHVFASCCNRGQPCTLFTVFGQFFHQCWLCFGTSIPMTQRRGSTHHP